MGKCPPYVAHGSWCFDSNALQRIGKYSLNYYERQNETEDPLQRKDGAMSKQNRETNNGNSSILMNRSRKQFSATVEQIMSDSSSIDMYPLSFAGLNEPIEQGGLQKYVERVLKLRMLEKSFVADGSLVSGVMTPEIYYFLRLLPFLLFLEDNEFWLRLKTRLLQVANLALSSTAVVLSSTSERNVRLIPAVIAGATLISQFLKSFDYERRCKYPTNAYVSVLLTCTCPSTTHS